MNENKKKENEKKVQELYLQFQLLYQRMQQIEKQILQIENQINDLFYLQDSLEDLKKVQKGKDTLMPLASGIFVKGKIESTDKILVNVGSNIVVEKTIDETKQLLGKQIEELRMAQLGFMQENEKINNQIKKIEEEMRKYI